MRSQAAVAQSAIAARAGVPRCLNITAHLDHRFGGLTTSLPPFCGALKATGKYGVDLAAFCEPDEVFTERAEVFPFGRLRWMRDASLRQRLAGLIRESSVVQIHGIWQEHCAMAASLAHASGTPYLIAAHGMLEPWAFRSKGWKKKLYWQLAERRRFARASCLRALTAAEREQYRALGVRTPVAVLPNGVDVPNEISCEPFFARYPELRGRNLLLFLGRLHPKKGIHILCEAWAKMCREYPDAHLVMAGPDFDGMQPELEAQLAQGGARERVTFTGMLRGEEKWGALRAAAAFLLPSYSEGFSMAVLEAVGVGTPVILSEQCYFPEVREYACGWVIEATAAAVDGAVRECLALTATERERMSAQARRLIAERFSWPVIGERTAAVLDWVLGGGAPPDCVETLS